MEVFSQAVRIEKGQPLGGYSEERLSIEASNQLELNGLAFDDPESNARVELCTIDALYAGELVDIDPLQNGHRIFAASHTHYAPMLDARKPKLGAIAQQTVSAWRAALHEATRRSVNPEYCRIYSAEISVPIYRRFDAPDGIINQWLSRHAGMFPNSSQPIDRNLYLFEFGAKGHTDFVLALHACHPVSRADRRRTSPDYVGALRAALRSRFGNVPCLFLLGCSGDIRPAIVRKRIYWLPHNRLNWQFEWSVPSASERWVDEAYTDAVVNARLLQSIDLLPNCFRVEMKILPLIHQGPIEFPCLSIGAQLHFEFIPFEISHLFHLDAQKQNPMRFIVSCADRTLGYLPHPKQIVAGGYEVDGSRDCMGLSERVLIKAGGLW